ncbi:MAG: shikimate kinase [Deltaproteobacteria bacterium]|nr:shikimate kinase [Deltaproteobacteria bacterium]
MSALESSHDGLLNDLGRAVRTRREAQSLTRKALALRASVSERFLAELEAGRGNVSVTRLQDIALALGSTASALLAADALSDTGAEQPRVLSLLGLRGAGKSTVGLAVAAALGVPFVELDACVEVRVGMSLAGLFELHGAAYYRRVERQALVELLSQRKPLVIATGGGIVTDDDTFAILRSETRTVWLRARPEDHLARVRAQGDTRPMANHRDALSDLRKILAEREPRYARADSTVDTSALGLSRSVKAVLRIARTLRSSA